MYRYKNKTQQDKTTFLDMHLTKDSSLLLHAFHSPCYWRILQKTIPYFGLKILQKILETRKLESIHE